MKKTALCYAMFFLVISISQQITANVITDENANPGTTDWILTNPSPNVFAGGRSIQIEGYCSDLSITNGGTIDIHVSTDPGSMYTAEIYRLGYYGGTGGRYMATYGPFQGSPQPTPSIPYQNLAECQWDVGFQITIPNDWVSGVYVGKLTEQANGYQSYVTFIVRDNRPSDLIYKVADFNWHAYNGWPAGSHLYNGPGGQVYSFDVEVSFDRPYLAANAIYPMNYDEAAYNVGLGEFLFFEWPLVYVLEQNGYDISYISCIDAHNGDANLTRTKGLLCAGHDEYWTQPLMDNVTAAVNQGMGLAVFSGNALFCALDLMPNRTTGRPDRTIERSYTWQGSERDLMGVATPTQFNDYGDFICTDPNHWVYEGTGMVMGQSIKDLIGWEMHDLPLKNVASMEVWSQGTNNLEWGGSYACTAYEGAFENTIVSASSIWWASHMGPAPGHINHGSFQAYEGGSESNGPFPSDQRVNQMTLNIVDRIIGSQGGGGGDTQSPTVPTNLSISNVSHNSFTLSWNASADNIGVIGYQIFQDGVSIATSATNSVDITGLDCETSYDMTVRATDASGNWSAQSSAFNAITASCSGDTEAPSVPINLAISNVTQNSFTLSWTASTDNVGVLGYQVFQDGSPLGTTLSSSLNISNLTCETSYDLTVRAIDEASNWSAQSSVLNASTISCSAVPDTEAPSIPTNLVASNISQNSFTLSWTASTDNTAVTLYEVFKDGISFGTTSNTSMVINGLSENATVSMTVLALDSAGNASAQSVTYDVTTLVTNIVGLPNGGNSFYTYPNPAKDQITISFFSKSVSNLSISISTISGNEVLRTSGSTTTGVNEVGINTKQLQNGIYFISLTSGNKTTTDKLTILK